MIALTMQTTAARGMYPSMLKTAVMTGNATQAVIMLVDFLDGSAQERAGVRGPLREYDPATVTYMIGVTAGTAGIAHLSFWSVLVPVALLAVLCVTPLPQAERH